MSFLACSVGWSGDVGDITGGLERTNRRAASEAVSGEAEIDDVISGA
jgi:hypothetical protein